MKNMKKILVTVVAALLLMTVTVMGTLAYLTSQTADVINTFTVGAVQITLDEAKTDEYGKVDETATERVLANAYKIVPGQKYSKDPTVHVTVGSEPCYLFVRVVNQVKEYEAGYVEDATEDVKKSTIAAQMEADGWKQLMVNENAVENVYYYAGKGTDVDVNGVKVDARKAKIDVRVFESVTLKGAIKAADMDTLKNKNITITAYAIQSDNLASASAAWEAVNNNFTTNAPAAPTTAPTTPEDGGETT